MTLEARNLALAGRLVDISCAIRPGTVTAICGPNGAGKSSLLSALAGLLPIDRGDVLLDGRAVSAMHPRGRAMAIGYLPQSGEVAWDVAVRNLVALGRLPYRDAGNSVAVTRAMAALDLDALADRPISTLSGGERARALLARVLAGEPRWILADEPLAALDLSHQQALLKRFRTEAANGAGIVMVVHDLALARNHADRVLVLEQGCLCADGQPGEALTREILRQVWQIDAQWVGSAGRYALQIG